MRYKIMCGGLLLVAAMLGLAQTKVDLRSQTRNVDFADATATRPFAVGTALPETCSPGQAFFKSNAPTGENLYLCTAPDTWGAAGASAPYFKQFPTAENSWTVAGAAHGLGPDVEVFVQEDDGPNWKRSYPGSVLIDKINGDITVSWSEPRAGRLMVSGLRGGSAGSGGSTAEAHAAQHQHGGDDEVATAVPAANAIPKADAAGRLGEAWIDAAISRDNEAVAAGDVSGSLASGYQINNQAISVTKLRAGNAAAAGYYVRVAEDGTQFTYQDPAEILAEAGAAPETHAAQHKHGGDDEVATAVPAAHAIPKANAAGRLGEAWIDAAISRDNEAVAAGDVSGSLASGYQINNQAIGVTKLRAGNAAAAGYYVRVAEDGTQFTYQDPAEILAEAGAAPETHAAQHKYGGDDEVATAAPAAHAIPKADVGGKLAAGWIGESSVTQHAAALSIAPSQIAGLDAGTDLTMDLEEEHHAAEHQHGGDDEIAVEAPAAHGIPKADASGRLKLGWLPEMTGDAGMGGQAGVVPAPAAGDAPKCLKGDGTWGTCLDHAAMENREAADQHPASSITNTPSGGVSATTVQAAIEELDAEKLATTARDEANGVAGLDAAGKVLRSTLPAMEGDSGEGGQPGAVPAPQAGDASKCLKGDGAWGECSGPVALDEAGAVTGILGAAHGGTGSGFTTFAGPAGTTKTFTLPDASATILTDHAAVTVAQGGTGIASGVTGGVPYFAGASSMASSETLAAGAVVLGGGPGAAPTTAGQITIQAAETSGTPVANAGDATSLARSNHEHLIPWQVGIPFTGAPTTGDFAVRLPTPANCGGSVSVTSVRVIAANKGTGPMTYQVYSCTNGASETCLSMFSGGNQTYSHTGNMSQQAATDQNNSNLSTSSFFKANIAAVNGQSGVTLIVNGRCKNI
ncbi:MAG: hypothetical protein KIT09_11365 [Bryobacteraceae bacterium]|nr:hypothetical protein [Bryobacteraceae bacterium]